MIQIVKRLDRLIQLKKRLAQQNVRPCRTRLQQHRPIQRLLRLGVLPLAHVRITQSVIQVRVHWIERSF